MSITIPYTNLGDMRDFEAWSDYYISHFARISDSALVGYWYMYGRDSEEDASPRDMAAWCAVNAEIDARDIQP